MKNFKLLICLLALVPFIASCSDDDDDTALSFSTNNVEIIVGQVAKVTITNGDGTYTATSADSKIATVNEAAKELTITGVAVGTTLVTVKDKSGDEGIIKVTVAKDPYAEMKADATTRFVWNEISKINGKDAGTYTFTRVENKMEFNYTSEDEKNTIVLSFTNLATPKATAPAPTLKDFKLLVDGKETKVDALEVVQYKKMEGKTTNTIWIAFKAGNKQGVCVATLSE